MKRQNFLIMMSGGTTPVINATLAGVLHAVAAVRYPGKVYAGLPGIEGVFSRRLGDLTRLGEADRARLYRMPGSSVVGTTRVALLSDQDIARFGDVLDEYDIGFVINIGGNGTIKQTKFLSRCFSHQVSFAACPKTVDNDLGDSNFADMVFTPGFPSCVNQWIHYATMLEIESRGAGTHDRILIAQTFGRETGFIAGAARLADAGRETPLVLLLPEDPRPVADVLDHLSGMLDRHGRAVVVMSEGYAIGDIGNRRDLSGQMMYGSNATTAAQLLAEHCNEGGMQARTVIPTVFQRVFVDRVLEFDRDVAFRLGASVVRELMEGRNRFLMAVNKRDPSGVSPLAFDGFSDFSRVMPARFMENGCFDVSDAYCDYLNSFFEFSDFEREYAGVLDGEGIFSLMDVGSCDGMGG